jgi:hypothetical protein
MKKILLSFAILFLSCSILIAQDEKPLLVKKFGGYRTGFEFKLLGYGKEGNDMIFDLQVTMIKGKDGRYTVSRHVHEGMKLITSGGKTYSKTWVKFGMKQSNKDESANFGAAYVYNDMISEIPVQLIVKFFNVEEDDFLLLSIPMGPYRKSQTAYKFKRSEIKK